MKKTLFADLGEKLVQYRKKAGYSRDSVIENQDITFSRSTLQAWELGEREPSLSGLHELSLLYGVDMQTMLFGEQEDKPHTVSDYDYVPFYKAEASAGHGSFLDEQRQPTHYLAFRKRWVKATGHAIKDLVGLIARGDSMEPTIKNSAAIIINTAMREPADGSVYVIRVGDMLWVKRIQWLLDGGLRLISDNSFYEPMDISKEKLNSDDIQIVGKVVHTAYDF